MEGGAAGTAGKIWNLAATLLGLAVFAGLMWWTVHAHSAMWRLLAQRHAGRSADRPLAKTLDSIVITRSGARGGIDSGNASYRSYSVTLTLHGDGLAIAAVPPFNIGCPRLFLPFATMDARPSSWGAWRDPIAVRMRDARGVDIVIGRDTIGWIRKHDLPDAPASLRGL